MKNFLLLYITKKDQADSGEGSWDPWMKWKEDKADIIVDFGSPLGDGKNLSDKNTLSDSKNVTGYSIIQAEDMGSAVKLLEDHPMNDIAGGEIEIYESMM
jgi:hypothetical protein